MTLKKSKGTINNWKPTVKMRHWARILKRIRNNSKLHFKPKNQYPEASANKELPIWKKQ